MPAKILGDVPFSFVLVGGAVVLGAYALNNADKIIPGVFDGVVTGVGRQVSRVPFEEIFVTGPVDAFSTVYKDVGSVVTTGNRVRTNQGFGAFLGDLFGRPF